MADPERIGVVIAEELPEQGCQHCGARPAKQVCQGEGGEVVKVVEEQLGLGLGQQGSEMERKLYLELFLNNS